MRKQHLSLHSNLVIIYSSRTTSPKRVFRLNSQPNISRPYYIVDVNPNNTYQIHNCRTDNIRRGCIHENQLSTMNKHILNRMKQQLRRSLSKKSPTVPIISLTPIIPQQSLNNHSMSKKYTLLQDPKMVRGGTKSDSKDKSGKGPRLFQENPFQGT